MSIKSIYRWNTHTFFLLLCFFELIRAKVGSLQFNKGNIVIQLIRSVIWFSIINICVICVTLVSKQLPSLTSKPLHKQHYSGDWFQHRIYLSVNLVSVNLWSILRTLTSRYVCTHKPDFNLLLVKTQNTFLHLQESDTNMCSLSFADPILCPAWASLPPTFFPGSRLDYWQNGLFVSHK